MSWRIDSAPIHRRRCSCSRPAGATWNPLIHIPIGFTKLTTPDVNWGYSTVPQPEMNNRDMWYPQGRTLGGSTSINAMIYIRGTPADYDDWAALGNDGLGLR